MTRRRILAAIVVVGLAESLVWLVAAWYLWSIRYLFASPGSTQAASNTLLALETIASTAALVIAVGVFLTRRRGWSWWLLTAVQIGDLAFSVFEALVRDWTWWLLAAFAAVTLAFLFLLRKAP